MAYKKTCDNPNCNRDVGGEHPFIQIHGSISEQIEDTTTGAVMYRYLTPFANAKMVFCNDKCENEWKDHQRDMKPFVERPLYPQG